MKKSVYLSIFVLTIFIFVLTIFIMGCGKFPELDGNYKLQYNGNSYIILTDTLNTILIRGHVINFASDNMFILVNQKPVDSICECNIECFKKMESYDKKSYKRCKEAFEKSSFRQFWIIDKSQEPLFNESTKTYSNIYGPYPKEEYLVKRKELGVPEELKLKFEE